jgi:hypothetical protein
MTIRPGGQAVLSMDYTMHPGMEGPHRFVIHVQTNDPDEPIVDFIAVSNWVN